MRRLTLLRHGRAEWPAGRYEDFDRPLDAVGIAQAKRAGDQLAQLPHPPTLCLASAALRTLQTARLAAHALKLDASALHVDRRLYLASAETILEVLEDLAGDARQVLLVGHNPGLSDLAGMLAGKPGAVGLATGEWRQYRRAGPR